MITIDKWILGFIIFITFGVGFCLGVFQQEWKQLHSPGKK
jgi:hypothetical protein